ncbi:shikimate dehydrogenase [Persicobacter psychrovividus]|uniref:Shikimate 5-dehydrogenase n=1 Tax=Persicobacter psychrovividus TaxID=387638 RepID=A0ABM7VGN5_9BACT|nr:shikimate 5-dehydrogenase [Persicobacter psychrovividus]
MKLLGLIGETLDYSFSEKYFTEKFKKEDIEGFDYKLFEIPNIESFPELLETNPNFAGINVTIPYKNDIIPYLKSLDESAQKIGAVNVIKFTDQGLVGYNSDYYGFRNSVTKWIGENLSNITDALVLGTGGASKAVRVALTDMGINVKMVSRDPQKADYTYKALKENPELVATHTLIVNTTPLGTAPNELDKVDLPYEALTSKHYLYDVVYNPEITAFMQEGLRKGGKAKNGYEMLVLQAEKSWEIWLDGQTPVAPQSETT